MAAIAAISIHVTDLAAAPRFYTEPVGFTVRGRWLSTTYERKRVRLDCSRLE